MSETDQLRSDDDLVGEQREFYRSEAADFDRWLTSLLDELNDDPTARHYRAARLSFQSQLADRSPLGHVLEIAAGGWRLAELYLPFASSAVLLDSSAESLALAADRLRHSTPSPTLVEADVFAWDAGGQTFDTIIFSAWLHHVPHSRFDTFWRGVASLLAHEGEVLFDYPDVQAAPRGARDIPDTPSEGYTFYEPRDGISIRDHAGRRWRVVHNLWDTAELQSRLERQGWTMTVIGTGLFDNILLASARR